jgi:uncharacterized membrane protein
METHKRSIIKAITWRLFSSILAGLIAYVFIREWTIAATIGGVDVLIKTGFYYAHERLWNYVSYGRRRMNAVETRQLEELVSLAEGWQSALPLRTGEEQCPSTRSIAP